MKAKKRTEFQTIGLVSRQDIASHEAFVRRLKRYLDKQNTQIIWDKRLSPYYGEEKTHTVSYIMRHSDLVISLGGDGTILRLVRYIPKKRRVCVLGVNLGTLGFNTEVQTPSHVFELLGQFLNGNYHLDERLLLRVTLYRAGEKIETHLALNEAVINQGNFARLISLKAEVDQRKMISFKADGVIVASPTGSTGHSLSAGGPILHPRVDALVFTPICPSELTVRPIAIPSDRQITITVETERLFKDNTIGLTIDGQLVFPVQYGDQIKVRKSSRKLYFIRKARRAGNYYKVLRDVLHWGSTG